MPANSGISGKMAPVALKAAGCATAFFLGGPAAAAMAAYGGEAILKFLELSGVESLKKVPEALAGNLGNFIAGAAYDSVKDANAGSLRALFRDALAATLDAVRVELIPEMRVEDRTYYEGWFERWAKRLQKDNLPEFTDRSLLQRFVRSDAVTVEEAVGPVLIEILMRLDAQGVLQLEQKPVDPVLEAALRERLPLHLPLQLSSTLADRDKLWKIVQDQKITLILQQIGKLQAPPVTAKPLLLNAKARKLAPSQGAFFGRADDVRELADRLAQDDGSILYVSGAPGIGKTALCRAALRQYLSEHAEAAALFVDLQAAVNLETLVAACAEVLGDRSLRNEGEVRQSLVSTAAKRGGTVVVYLDNFESVAGAEGAVAFVRSLAELGGIRVLCSTRLNLSSAVGLGMEVHALDADSAADLFLQCWHRGERAPRMKRTPELDGFLRDRLSFHPLSIVLTASRGAFYRSLARVIEEWSTQGTKFAAAGKESLRQSLLLSWKILTEEERQSFLLLALFAEGVTSATWGELVELVPKAWAHRARLSELSLIEDAVEGDGLSVLAPVREFVVEESRGSGGPDLGMAVGTALEYFGRLAAAGSEIEDTPAVVAARLRMVSEFLNLRAVLGRIEEAKASTHVDLLRALSGDLGNTYVFGVLPGHSVAQRLLRLMEATGSQVGLANTLRSLGDLEFRLGRNSEARSLFERALPLYEATGAQLGLANTLRSLGDLEFRLGRNSEARSLFERALPLYEATGAQLGLANTLRSLGDLEFRLGRNSEARSLFERALPLYEATGDQLGLANSLRSLGNLEFRIGRNSEARSLFERALPLFEATGDQVGLANTLSSLGDLEFLLGRNSEARSLFERALPLYEATGAQLGLANTLSSLGDLEFRLGRNSEARSLFDRALPLFEATGAQVGLANTLGSLGDLEFRLGRNSEARSLFERALPLFEATGDQVGLANTLCSLGELELDEGAAEVAESLFQRACGLYEEVQEPLGLAISNGLLCRIAFGRGDSATAMEYRRKAEAWATVSESPAIIEWVGSLPRL